MAGSGGAPLDASTEDSDAGFTCTPSQWRDWANGWCAQCPAADLNCAQFDQPTTLLDPVSKKLLITLLPSKSEIVTATISFQYMSDLAPGQGSVADVPMTVSGNTLQADLAGKIPDMVYAIAGIELKLLDACGKAQMVIDFGINMTSPGSSADILIHCEQ